MSFTTSVIICVFTVYAVCKMGDYGEICLFIVAWGYTGSLLCLLVSTPRTDDEDEEVEEVAEGDHVRFFFWELVGEFQRSHYNHFLGSVVRQIPLEDYCYDGKCLFIIRGEAKAYDFLHDYADKLLTRLVDMGSCQPLIKNLWGLSRFEYDHIAHTKPFTAPLPESYSQETFVLFKGKYKESEHLEFKQKSFFHIIKDNQKYSEDKYMLILVDWKNFEESKNYDCRFVNNNLCIVLSSATCECCCFVRWCPRY